ncbi:tryptophan ABC transporter substrate-binding protein [Weissella hellenica]|uniref:ABC transport system substrate-binding protein n=1 Tax=Weissella hellenica TaxID=46256 RepID=A0A4Y4G3P1_WEIHE|nr:tryptophan ABC transporter substrate-binding protein [Weissella hellenica]NKY67080.1 ABC transporter substrate-binding protein [Weissella hellenica]GED36096.1 ABC transporter substrate-binding protein [Weissella hellenica]SCB95417.1 putative ABC transport system substrate-binding protein [Weissella hellenica]
MNKKILATIGALTFFTIFAGVYDSVQTNQKKTIPKVAILQFMKHPALDDINKGIHEGLSQSGYHEGKNIKIMYENAQGDQSNLKTMASKFENANADVSIGIATPAAVSLANTIKDKAVVFSASTTPIQSKLVKSYKHPGGNVTGVSDQAPLSAQLKMMRKFVPDLKNLGVIYTSSDDSASIQAKQMMNLAKKAGLQVKPYTISSSNDLNQTAKQMVANNQVDAVFVPTDNTIAGAMPTLIDSTNAAKVPVFPTVDTMVADGGLAAESINQKKLGVQTGKQVAQILDGKQPKDLPVGFIKKGDLVINKSQLARLGLVLPNEYKHAKFVK